MYDEQKMKQATELFLEALGHPDWRNDPNTQKTPERVAKMYRIMLGGYDIDPKQYLRVFPATTKDMVLVREIPAISWCAHHLLPFVGKLAIAYIPNESLIGLSKLIRFARTELKKLQLQENLTANIADTLNDTLKPQGVMVYLEAMHLCMTIRGVRSHGAITVTSAVRGIFKEDARARSEFMEAIQHSGVVYKY